jgi:hypothetical protein
MAKEKWHLPKGQKEVISSPSKASKCLRSKGDDVRVDTGDLG